MLIKIIDDDETFIERIHKSFNKLIDDYFYNYSFEDISENFDLVDYGTGDIFFLDINLNGYSGIEIAKRIRECNHNVIIIFVSAMNDLVFDSFIAQPFYFIRKGNYNEDMMIACELIKKYVLDNYKVITFDLKGRKTAIKLSDIIYIESYLHEMVIHTKDDRYNYSGTFKSVVELINSTNIVRVHKSYAVNLFWVKEIREDNIIFNNGYSIKCGYKYKNDFINSYKEYLLRWC